MSGAESTKLLKIGRWTVSPSELRLTCGDETESVEAKVMDVLVALVAAKGDVLLREELINQVWGTEFGGDESLTRAISLLRKAFGDSPGDPEYIRTVPRKGYQLIAPVSEATGATANDVRELPSSTAAQVASAAAGPEAVIPAEPTTRRGVLAGAAAAMLALVALVTFGSGYIFPSAPDTPLVMIMDSAHPSRIYDDDVRDTGGTNADILSDILSDLPVRTQKELISPSWHRYEAITRFAPDLIVIHYSGFKQEDARGPRPQLKLLVEYFQKTDTEFLIYSRASQEWLDGKVSIMLEDLYAENPGLKSRVEVFPLDEYGEPVWGDQNTAQAIKLKIKDMLELD